MNSALPATRATLAEIPVDPVAHQRLYARLVHGFHRSLGEPADRRWMWLMAAHIVGQTRIGPHLDSHVLMLHYALKQRAWGEVSGQLFRLALVPIGHVVGRLPVGNIGRATVNAFQPMPLTAELARVIGEASASVATP